MKAKNELTKSILKEYLLTIALSLGVLILVPLIFKMLFSLRIWQGDEFVYPLLNGLNNTLPIWIVGAPLLTWLLITYLYFKKNISYLEELLVATKTMVAEPEKKIELSRELVQFQDELNQIRFDNLLNKQLAIEADKKKNDLIVYLAHDLRTPLTSIIGYLSLLQKGRDDKLTQEKKYDYIKVTLDKSYRLEQLINELFELTKLNSADNDLNKTSVNISTMVEQIAYEFIPDLDKKEQDWNLEIAEGVMASVDVKRFERIMDNIIKNASNYAPNSTTIHCKLYEENSIIYLKLKNRSSSISKEAMAELFNPFFRGDYSRSSETGNSGLGLSITKVMVEAHGGTISSNYVDNNFEIVIELPSNQ